MDDFAIIFRSGREVRVSVADFEADREADQLRLFDEEGNEGKTHISLSAVAAIIPLADHTSDHQGPSDQPGD
jgi:hypothetical protein